jgi:hypothetical protein
VRGGKPSVAASSEASDYRGRNRFLGISFIRMPKNPIKIEVLQEGDERFLLQTFADGSEERKPIVKQPRKPPRFRYRKVTLDKFRKKGF